MKCELLDGDGTLGVRIPGRPTLPLPRKTKPVAFRKPDFLLNTILDEQTQVGGVVAGEYRQAHEVGCRIVDRV